ncbi:MAG: tRNA pseudouridine(55) synthase TruB [Malacoplasma sp.]|nr:tRNA pseudouridine(55) synthase TruB [Malacoplasma sp.]
MKQQDKIIVINKPKGLSSNQAMQIVKKNFKAKKAGYLGTLDPLATGVLVIALNKSTKELSKMENDTKSYIAQIVFGIETETYDFEGKIIKRKNVQFYKDDLINNLKKKNNFSFMQEVPIYSAVKVNGKKLFEYALKGEKINLPKKKVTIFKIKLISWDEINKIAIIYLNVSKGFYVRSFAHDTGLELNTYATLKNLTRIRSGKYHFKDVINQGPSGKFWKDKYN